MAKAQMRRTHRYVATGEGNTCEVFFLAPAGPRAHALHIDPIHP